MSGKDYYKILGVAKSASKDEIKKAYRKMALQYHPDRNKGDKAAEDRFKEISEAYAVLSDSEKKKQYDMFGADGFQQRYTQDDIFRDMDFGSIFKEFGFGGGGRGGSHIFSQIFGGTGGRPQYGRGGPFGGGQPRGVKGQDLIYELPVTLEEAVNTTEKVIAYQVDGRQERISTKIPAGISTGKKLRLTGKGNPGAYGGPNGDLYVQIKVLDHPLFKREGDDLILARKIKFSDALLGTELDVPTIDKKTMRIKIPAGTQNNAKFRLKGQGMPHMNKKGRGDAYVQVTVEVPKKLDKKQKALAEELRGVGL
ncbi:MAG: DnaJ domain-containing protein [Deltaproteobacteria bacterium]|nr:DnaJ domain-containing protein [Deltaproteobacteria bacterium]